MPNLNATRQLHGSGVGFVVSGVTGSGAPAPPK